MRIDPLTPFFAATVAAAGCAGSHAAEPPPEGPETAQPSEPRADAAPVGPASSPQSSAVAPVSSPHGEPPPLKGGSAESPFPTTAPPGADGADAASGAPAPGTGTDAAALRGSGRAAQDCYAASVGSDLPAKAAGELVLRVSIKPDGSVASVATSPERSTKELLAGAFESCVLRAVRGQTFAVTVGGESERVLDIPLKFSPPE